MSEDNPLGNIREQMEQAEEEEVETEDVEEEEEPEDPLERPAFKFQDAKQRPIYPREETWEDYEDLKFEVEGKLREQDIKNMAGREFDEAILQIAKEKPEKIAQLVLENREQN